MALQWRHLLTDTCELVFAAGQLQIVERVVADVDA